MMEVFERLARPFELHELKFFPAATNREKTLAKVAAYVDARAVMDRLDEVVPGQWQTAYRVVDPATKTVECTLTVVTEGGVITRADVGYPNEARDADNADKEPYKAAYSDALKRAAVQFGIGRYIYSLALDKDWLPIDQHGRFTEQPRLRGAAQQRSEPAIARNGAPAAAPPPKDVRPVADMPIGEWWGVTRQRGYDRDEVVKLSLEMYKKEPADCEPAERELMLSELPARQPARAR